MSFFVYSSWLLARCRVCGSAGTHRLCGKLTTIANWACISCLDFEARCTAKKVMEESIVKAPKVLVMTTSVPSKPSERGKPSRPTIVEKRKRIKTGRKPPKRPPKKPEFKAPLPPPPIKTTRAKKEKPIVAVPEPKKVTEVKKSRKRKTENIQKRTYKRRKRNDLTPEDIEWLEAQEEETSVDLSKVHIGSACGDFFPYTKKVKKDFATQGFDYFPDWRGYSLQVQVVNIFLDLVDPILPQNAVQKTEAKVTKSVSSDTVSKKNTSKVVNQILGDTANKKDESKIVDSISKKNGRKVVKSVAIDTAPKRRGRRVVTSVPTDIIPKKSERIVAKSVRNDTLRKNNEKKVAEPIPTDVVSKKYKRKVAKSVPTEIATKTPEKLPSINNAIRTSTSNKKPKKRGRRKRSKWMRGVVKKKKTTSAKAKSPVKSKDTGIIESLKTVDKKSEKDKPASASKAILEGIRRSHESLLQFQQGKSTIKVTDEQGASSDKKQKQNGVTPKIDEIVAEKGSKRRRPSLRGTISETGNEGFYFLF